MADTASFICHLRRFGADFPLIARLTFARRGRRVPAWHAHFGSGAGEDPSVTVPERSAKEEVPNLGQPPLGVSGRLRGHFDPRHFPAAGGVAVHASTVGAGL
jgi:hypothetical protein